MRARWLEIGVLSVCACGASGPEAASAMEIAILETAEQIEGRDGGVSAVAWERSIWVYGDTVLTLADARDSNWHHNSFSMTTDLDASDGITGFVEPLDSAGAPLHLIAPSPEEQAFNDAHAGDPCEETPCGARWAVWPGSPIFDAARDRALVFYGLIYAEPGDFNFEGVGTSIAIWTDPDGLPERPVIDPDAEHPDLMFGAGEPGWGVGATIVDDQLYNFACDGGDGPGHACRLARVDLGDVLDRAAWQYFDGEGWSADMDEVAVLFAGAPILSVAWSEHLDAWLAIYSEPFSSKVRGRTAPELSGPWSREATLYDAGEDTPYDAVQHPEYDEDGGRVIYVTYSRPTTGWFGAEFPIVRIELAGETGTASSTRSISSSGPTPRLSAAKLGTRRWRSTALLSPRTSAIDTASRPSRAARAWAANTSC